MTELHTSDFDYHLREELIAARPADRREQARLLHLTRADGGIGHRHIYDLPSLLRDGDLLVVNDTRVIPARLLGRRAPGGGRVEALLIRSMPVANAASNPLSPSLPPASSPPENSPRPPGVVRWEALVRPGKRIRVGDRLVFDPDRLEAVVAGFGEGPGARILEFSWRGGTWDEVLETVGKTPLPPYILRRRQSGALTYPWDDGLTTDEDRVRYQTVYARQRGSIAAPTAGLHFTPEILDELRGRGIERAAVTLQVGPGTFQPVETDDPRQHPMHEEEYVMTDSEADRIEAARAAGRRIVAVGTTVVRVLEHVVSVHGRIVPDRGATRLLILPGHEFKSVGVLLTNFHLPRSTLLMLVSAFAGRELVLRAYEEAVNRRYRFYSYGDAMLVE
jgi:S-adenosylmethionine:tRNA ribosyltransferase-isomerase